MQETLIDQGINLMLFGMGTVFVFLTILVFATTFMSNVVNRFVTQVEPQKKSVQQASAAADTQNVSPQIVSAIQKAIAAHRQK